MDPMLRDLREAASVEGPPERRKINFKRIFYVLAVLILGAGVVVAGFYFYPKLAALRAPFSKWRRVVAIGTRSADAIASYGSAIFVGAKGGLYKSLDAGNTWEADEYWLNLPKQSTPNHPWKILINDTGLRMYAASASGIHFSKDAGQSWDKLPFSIYIPSLEREVTAVSDIAICREQSDVILAVVRDAHLVKSDDGGQTWTLLHEWISPDFLYISPKNPDTIYVDISPTRISVDGGITIDERAGSFPALAVEKDYYVDPIDINRIIVVGYGGIYMSTDGGVVWSKAGQAPEWKDVLAPEYDLPKGASSQALSIDDMDFVFTSVVVHPLNRNVIVVSAQDEGVLISVDAGQEWHWLRRGLPDMDDEQAVEFRQLAWNADGSQLYLLTSGGVYLLQ